MNAMFSRREQWQTRTKSLSWAYHH